MLVYRHHMRPNARVFSVIAWAAGLGLMMVGCSASDTASDPSSPDVTVPTAATGPVQSTTSVVDGPPPGAVDVAAPTPLRVDLTLDVDPSGLHVEMGAGGEAATTEAGDPFGTFASCSGGRRAFGPYSVLVSALDGPVAAVSLLTRGSVQGASIYDADVNVEMRAGTSQFATGTLTIDLGLRSGSFVAFAPDGGKLSGSFECSGGDPSSAPLVTGADDGVLDTIEVFALLRRGDSERVVGLAVQISRSPEVSAECPAVLGAMDPLLVRVDGDASLGAVETFELTGGDGPAMRMSVAGTTYEFDDVAVTVEGVATAGTFSGTVDGMTVDGAFRCT